MHVSRQDFRDGMARLGAAVNVVTTAGPGGRYGLTASAVCSVTDDPPTLLVCLNRTSHMNATVKANGVLCVNVLTAEQQELSRVFAGMTGIADGAKRFGAAGSWATLTTGAPVLAEAVAAFDCRVAEVVEKGTHSVVFAEVVQLQLGEPAKALIWYGRGFHPVGHVEAK
jgi:flavin reductase